MLEKNHGHVVTIASSAGFFGVSGLCDYCASKFGAVGFDESLFMELGIMKKDDVHTTVICPFFINTGMFDGVKTRYIFMFNSLYFILFNFILFKGAVSPIFNVPLTIGEKNNHLY